MSDRKAVLSKAKGIEIISDMLFAGKERKEIVEKFTTEYKVSVSAVDKWLKSARIIAQQRMEETQAEKRALIKETTKAMVERLGLTQEIVLKELKKIADFNIKSIHDKDGKILPVNEWSDEAATTIVGIEHYATATKIKTPDRKAAWDSIRDMLGYSAPKKIAETDTDGNDIPLSERKISFK